MIIREGVYLFGPLSDIFLEVRQAGPGILVNTLVPCYISVLSNAGRNNILVGLNADR